ncbi:MAG: hypothetical protein RLZ33_407 [Bacteroidota bacterium]|jgi:outer membrane protein OmpA-like peptidoglycan-associated protein
MVNLRLIIVFVLFSTFLFSQAKKIETFSIADCEGAVNIFKSGNYSVQFTASGGQKPELSNYPSLTDISENNIVWISYIAPSDGVLSLKASLPNDYLQMVIFEEMENNICSELPRGVAEVKRIYKGKDLPSVGLDINVKNGFLYPMTLSANQKILIGFATSEKSKGILQLNFNFAAENVLEHALNETKIIDERNDEFAPSFSITVRDVETNEPIIANITIEGSKEMTALYSGSDIFLNVTRSGRIYIKCDAEGYFFVDKELELVANSEQVVNLKMQRLKKGSSLQIEEIEFKPGTSEFMTGSEGKLNRLKDFMASNAEINIEIQGHVYMVGENSISAQKLSEARAKRVLIYLADHGIDKNRMISVGYGNTKPIYPNAKLAYEEQANRRVEIVLK